MEGRERESRFEPELGEVLLSEVGEESFFSEVTAAM
jgi:hypothetical protein